MKNKMFEKSGTTIELEVEIPTGVGSGYFWCSRLYDADELKSRYLQRRGFRYLRDLMARRVADGLMNANLNESELWVLSFAGSGVSSKQIAKELEIANEDVHLLVGSILSKLAAVNCAIDVVAWHQTNHRH